MLRDNPDKSWNNFGTQDPYYGVLAEEKYRKEKIDPKSLNEFFQTGNLYITQVLSKLEKHFGKINYQTALDFGCGTARLTIPIAKKFKTVIGVDVSDSMLDESRKNCDLQNISNVKFVKALKDINHQFDFVNSYIVLQHIPKKKGCEIINNLISLLKPNGYGSLHLTFYRKAPNIRKIVHFLRKKIKPLHYLYNIYQKKPFFEPFMQMNNYNLNEIVMIFEKNNIKNIFFEITKHGSHIGVIIYFQK